MGLRSRIKDALAPYPALFRPLYRCIAPPTQRGYMVGPGTEILISGFPRSANTFAVVAFRVAQDRAVGIAHHLHVEAEILAATRRGLPAIVVMRRPADALRSLVLADPATDPGRALDRWIAFHTAVARVSAQVVLSDFARTTGDFGGVIEEVNARFGTAFEPFVTNPSNVARVFAEIEEDQRLVGSEAFAGRPDPDRRRELARVPLALDPARLARADALYEALLSAR